MGSIDQVMGPMEQAERMAHMRDMYIYTSIPVLFIVIALGIWFFKRSKKSNILKNTNEHK